METDACLLFRHMSDRTAVDETERLSVKREDSCTARVFPLSLDRSGDLPDQYNIALR